MWISGQAMTRSKIRTGTKLDREKRSKRAAGEFEEKLDAMGQEDEYKASKAVIEENKRIEKKKQKDLDDALHFFSKNNKRFTTYYQALARQIHHLLHNYVDWQGKWLYEATVNEGRGVGVMVKGPDGKIFARGFKPCGEPKYDLNALKVLILQTENIVDEYAQKQAGTGRPDLEVSEAN